MRIEAFLHGLGQPWRRAGEAAWGVTFPDVGGWPLDVGLAVCGPEPALLRLQAPVCEPGRLDPADLLHRNRRLRLVRFTSTRAGEVWLQGELPWPLADERLLDVALALLLDAAEAARQSASAARTERSR
ncbi:hypothetical protein NBH00_15450 [Paraconexibacter antarcticus]|uniref:Uncharacterized protein n=1 Tax=Paraconexibacter antarcticus TaxID=2949664 RepID=A0ABY5DNW8_9ACTN|nr:hypothetical protein [Paraconexibacter antarcticus]UTI62752.1 hypothetical protein NBH00_15450 [Paraconexibacter antarcticus]